MKSIKTLIVQENLRHYQVPAQTLLASHPDIDLTVVYGTNVLRTNVSAGQENVEGPLPFRVIHGPMGCWHLFGRAFLWHRPAIELLRRESFDVVIHVFEASILSLGYLRRYQQGRGKKFILWGIGQSLYKTPLLDRLRCRMVRKADAVVFYAEDNRRRFLDMGLNSDKLFVARNSIDLTPVSKAIQEWPSERLNTFEEANHLRPGPVLLTVGRLMARKRIDLLLESAARLIPDWPTLKVVIIGNGPEEQSLRTLSGKLGLDTHVVFTGSIIGDEAVAPWFLASSLVVAPAQVGHLATHAHAYSRPLITCDNCDIQGPEVKILVPGQTGLLYPYGNGAALTDTIATLLNDKNQCHEMGKKALTRAYEYCGIPRMMNGFLEAISYVTGIGIQPFQTS